MPVARALTSLLLLVAGVTAFRAVERPAPATPSACLGGGTIHADVVALFEGLAGPYGLIPYAAPAPTPAEQARCPSGPSAAGSATAAAKAADPRVLGCMGSPLRHADALWAAPRPGLRSFISHPSTAPPLSA